ncbi:uncharacterized protein LOC128035464 [Gossypium raimondii]|uniref:uncharacterized protein LOC128035464 n=1 Tax=Gossypium raimondii TaxID=29730 RepID=UPI00227BB074|nr:uncharacterized protein LOC128035464 [Gossypium raimondii]
MKILSWNVRGLGRQRTIRRLRYLLKENNPQIVFFMETKLNKKQIEIVRRRCGFLYGIEVEAEGTKGGLCLAWRTDMDIMLRSFSKRHIGVSIEDKEKGAKWRFIGFYGSPYVQDRYDSWEVLKRLASGEVLPWLVCGDFNEIMYGFEKKGGLPRDERRMELFRKMLEDCYLFDVGYEGNWFTWERGELLQRLERLKEGLKEWARRIQFNRKKSKRILTAKLEELVVAEMDDMALAELIDTKISLNFEIEKDECYWEQRARTNWLKFGDKNTKFFHSQASQRKKRNFIHKLKNEKGEEMVFFQDVEVTARAYFQNLFSAGRRGNYDHILSGVERCINEEDNQRLTAPYSREEVIEVVFDMGPTKAPREDGFPAAFYQKCWQIVGEDVISYCLRMLNGEMKVITNRLRIVIGKCIDEAQSAFVLGQLISDNVLLAYEVLHKLKLKRLGKKGFMAVKLDMSKAYDRRFKTRRPTKSVLISFVRRGLIESVKIGYEERSNDPERYLGLPNMVGRKKKEAFQNLKDHFKKCIDNWSIRGDIISIWEDNWIQGVEKIGAQNRTNKSELQSVSDLIDLSSRKWKMDVVNSTFQEEIARKILQIPLTEFEHEDFQVWRGELSGEFSVRSAYKLLQDANRLVQSLKLKRMDPGGSVMGCAWEAATMTHSCDPSSGKEVIWPDRTDPLLEEIEGPSTSSSHMET